jgi:hypothetical protein
VGRRLGRYLRSGPPGDRHEGGFPSPPQETTFEVENQQTP